MNAPVYEQLPAGSAVITPNQMYAELHEVGRKVEKLTNVIDPALAELRKDLDDTDKRASLLEARVRAIEHWRFFVLGVSCVVGVIAGYGGSLLVGVS